ncbi:LuxR C-terminal-related transcriptional regulator [Micromonospora sp. NBC_01638]|uniref:LuxR C-terminal-related transcriptional regulator n=1 Tax=Micromonospora sp. NBC_01638 TaxID=2975982 RepID=UPI003869FD9A|nr:LuxR C-terminal-related transcriptional regulator [Micromonospora sp. NBC_01638]
MLSPEIARRLITMVANSTSHDTDQLAARERLQHLSARESQVAKAVADGKSNADIAAALTLTVPTVMGYRVAGQCSALQGGGGGSRWGAAWPE